MRWYIIQYIIPVLVVMAIILVIARMYNGGINFKTAVLLSVGFLLG